MIYLSIYCYLLIKIDFLKSNFVKQTINYLYLLYDIEKQIL